jgi:hypothetical protein
MYHFPPCHISDDGIESNIHNIATQICSELPKIPCSYRLFIDEQIDNDIECDIMRDFTLSCIHILFGEHMTPCELSSHQYELLNSYVNSVGYTLLVNVVELPNEYQYRISFEKYGKSLHNPFEHLKKYMNQ